MVTSVNGMVGSSVTPVGGDDYMFLGRGNHVVADGNNIRMIASSSTSLNTGIANSMNSKISSVQETCASMKLIMLERIGSTSDYLLKCDSGWPL